MEIRLYKLSKILWVCVCVATYYTYKTRHSNIQCCSYSCKTCYKVYISYIYVYVYVFFLFCIYIIHVVSCGSDRYKCGIRLNNFCCSQARVYSPPIIPSIYIRFIFLHDDNAHTHCIFLRQSWQVLFLVVHIIYTIYIHIQFICGVL